MNRSSASSSGRSRTDARFEKNESTASKNEWNDSPRLAAGRGHARKLTVIGVDRAEASRVAHGDLVLYNPLSEAALEEAIALLALPRGARVLDVACGRAEVLRRVAERYEVEPAGYDADPALVDAAPAELGVTLAEAPAGGDVRSRDLHRVEPRARRLS